LKLRIFDAASFGDLSQNIFPHLDILHLVFNVWWLWIFGTKVESALGHAKTALLVLFVGCRE